MHPQAEAADSAAPAAPVPGSAPDPSGWCADAAIAPEVDAAGPEQSGMHVSPEDMRVMGADPAHIERTVQRWLELSTAEVTFQQCLRVRQNQPPVEPPPGATW